MKRLADLGFPIVEAARGRQFVVTKHPGTGGVVNVASVTEQLVYEMGDPNGYITPDGVADFTTIQLRQAGQEPGRGSAASAAGRRTPMLKVSIAWFYGYKAVGTLVYALARRLRQGASAADAILRQRLAHLGLEFEQILTEYVGVDATHGRLAGPPAPTSPRSAPGRCPGRSARRSSASPGRSRRSCSPARPASPGLPADARRSRRSWPTGRRWSRAIEIEPARAGGDPEA